MFGSLTRSPLAVVVALLVAMWPSAALADIVVVPRRWVPFYQLMDAVGRDFADAAQRRQATLQHVQRRQAEIDALYKETETCGSCPDRVALRDAIEKDFDDWRTRYCNYVGQVVRARFPNPMDDSPLRRLTLQLLLHEEICVPKSRRELREEARLRNEGLEALEARVAPLRRRAKAGEAEAQYLLAIELEKHRILNPTNPLRKSRSGDPLNPSDEALALMRRAANQGHARAELWLLERPSRESEEDLKRWAEHAAKDSDPAVKSAVASFHASRGGSGDQSEAARGYRAAAEGGDIGAHHMLGRLYEEGRGVPRDPVEARKWYEKGAMVNVAKLNGRDPRIRAARSGNVQGLVRLAQAGDAESVAVLERVASFPDASGYDAGAAQRLAELAKDGVPGARAALGRVAAAGLPSAAGALKEVTNLETSCSMASASRPLPQSLAAICEKMKGR